MSRRFLALVAITPAAWLTVAPTALAQQGERVGENIGELLGGWAASLFVGLVAIVSLVFLANRRYSELAVFLVVAVVVGAFALVPDAAAQTIRGIVRAITAG